MKRDQTSKAAEQLLAVLEALPPQTPRDVTLARRIEGAVLALRATSGLPAVPPPASSPEQHNARSIAGN